MSLPSARAAALRWPPVLPATLRDLVPRYPAGGVPAGWEQLCDYLYEGVWRGQSAFTDEIRDVAGRELDLLALSCRGSRLRAASAALTVMQHVLEGMSPHPAQGPAPAHPPRRPPRDSSRPAGMQVRVGGGEVSVPAAVDAGFGRSERALALAEELERVAPWVGWHARGSVLEEAIVARLDELSRWLDRVPELRRIADLLGKVEAEARAARGLERGGRAGVMGVRFGGELADVLPSEWALLADSATEDLFYARFAERRLLSLQLAGEGVGLAARVRRVGPVIACIDTSGSMKGRPEELAKAALLAVARRVLGAGRRMTVLLFGGRDAMREIALRPGFVDLDALVSLLMTSYYGGTDVAGPLRRALALRADGAWYRRADILLVTDGLCRPSAALQAELAAARRDTDLEVVSVVIGGHVDRVAPLSDVVWPLMDAGGGAAVGLSAYE